MTVEHRIVVSLGDIKSVSLKCDKCEYRVTMPPGDVKEIPHGCPYGHKWQQGEFERINGEPITYMFAGLAKLRILTSQKATGFQILFEYDEPKAD